MENYYSLESGGQHPHYQTFLILIKGLIFLIVSVIDTLVGICEWSGQPLSYPYPFGNIKEWYHHVNTNPCISKKRLGINVWMNRWVPSNTDSEWLILKFTVQLSLSHTGKYSTNPPSILKFLLPNYDSIVTRVFIILCVAYHCEAFIALQQYCPQKWILCSTAQKCFSWISVKFMDYFSDLSTQVSI